MTRHSTDQDWQQRPDAADWPEWMDQDETVAQHRERTGLADECDRKCREED